MDSIIIDVVFIGSMIFGIWGLLNFNKFVEQYIKFMDSKNSYNIQYPKGSYLKFILFTALLLSVFMGLAVLLNYVLIILKLYLGV